MTLSYYSPTTKALIIGLCSAFTSFAIFGAILLYADKLPQNPGIAGMILSTALAWIGVMFLHKATFGRQY
ncbi:MAG: hypothetical protein J6N49_01740 [Alphaproteobacteria bacterium]|nr:hypothetical protein [Alphaproteobacteria bacterium]